MIMNRLKQLLHNQINYFLFSCLCLCSFAEFMFTLPETRNNNIIEYYNGYFGLYSVNFILIPLFIAFLISNDCLYENAMVILRYKNKKTFFFSRSITLLLDSMIFLMVCLFVFFTLCILFSINGIKPHFFLHLFITSILHWLGFILFSLIFYTARYIFFSKITAFCIVFGILVVEFMSFTTLIPFKLQLIINSSFIAGILAEKQNYELALIHLFNILLKLISVFGIGIVLIDNFELKGNYSEIK